MADSDSVSTRRGLQSVHFDVSTGLKRVLGRELITDDEVAIFELVKNSFDAGATEVRIHFREDAITIADNGVGMSYDDLIGKWLFVAYSAKRAQNQTRDFRDMAAERGPFAGSKGIGRFSSDRIGQTLWLQTRPKSPKSEVVHTLRIDWKRFEHSDREKFEDIPIDYSPAREFNETKGLQKFISSLNHGTIIELGDLRRSWPRADILALKASLAKLINPFGSETDGFQILVSSYIEDEEDKKVKARAAKKGEKPLPKDIVNGRVGNSIFFDLKDKTTFITVWIHDDKLNTILVDRGETIYRIQENNPYRLLEKSGFRAQVFYLNQAAKQTFARRMGLPSIQFGSVFLFRNQFRVYPVGEDGDDWFGINRRKQQGYSRYLGSREIMGRVDVSGADDDFQEASSRDAGLISTPAVKQLQTAVMDHCIKRLERYVVPVSWADQADANAEDLSRLKTDPGRARVSAAIAGLVDNDDVELLEYSKNLVDVINERSEEFETSLVSMRAIAEKAGDKQLLTKLDRAEKRYDDLKRSESEARKIADRERAIALKATERATVAESTADVERRRAHFLESVVSLDTATILNLHHQVTIYSVDITHQIDNFLSDTAQQKSIPRELVLKALEQIAFLNKKIQSIARFAPKANFKLDSEKIEADLPTFITEYIENVARASSSARLRIEVRNSHPGYKIRFNPIDISIVVDNLLSNARRAKASRIIFDISQYEKSGVLMRVSDNGPGLSRATDSARIFDMGYTTTSGSGLGLYHVQQVLGEMGGSIEVDKDSDAKGMAFRITISRRK